jgi:putative ABC transport system permease protein
MKSILRNFLFVLNRFKTSSVLNIIGLSAAFLAFIVILIQVNYDFRYDRQFKHGDEIYYLTINSINGRFLTMPTTMGQEIADKFPEVKSHCLIQNSNSSNLFVDVLDNKGLKRKLSITITLVTAGFLDVFTPEIVEGTTQGIFARQGIGLITEKEAKKLFGNTSPIGKTVYYHSSKRFYNNQTTNSVTIQAVCKDFPDNCSISNGIFILLPNDSQANYSYYGYFVVGKKDVDKLSVGLNSEKLFGKEEWQEMQKSDRKLKVELTPLHEVHFEFERGRLITTLSLLLIGVLTLFIAYINFMNFAIAIAPTRVKSFNIQRIIGASTFKLKWTIASEAVFFSAIAFFISLCCISLLKRSVLSNYFPAKMSLLGNWELLLLIGISSLVFALFFGWYPTRYIASFQPAMALNGSFSLSRKSVKLRNSLIFIQFLAATTLIIVALSIQRQTDFMQRQPWGIEKDNIVYLYLGDSNINMHTFGEELKRDPRILDYTAADALPGHIGTIWTRTFDGKSVQASIWTVQTNFLDFFGIQVTDGRNFAPQDSARSKHAIIFNENFLYKNRLAKEIIGKPFEGYDENLTIVGISKNVNYSSLKDSIQPMGFATLDDRFMNWLFIKLSKDDVPGGINLIQKTWKNYSDDDCDIKFLDETLEKLYKNETNLAKLISAFGLVTILIAVMGVYGLVIFNTKSREKEIAIRKVNGASIAEIMLLLNSNILILLLLSYVAAIPISYYIVTKWLQQFAYKAPITWLIVALTGLLIFIVTVATVSLNSYKASSRNPVKSLKAE